mgnify:CR=1 FL=1
MKSMYQGLISKYRLPISRHSYETWVDALLAWSIKSASRGLLCQETLLSMDDRNDSSDSRRIPWRRPHPEYAQRKRDLWIEGYGLHSKIFRYRVHWKRSILVPLLRLQLTWLSAVSLPCGRPRHLFRPRNICRFYHNAMLVSSIQNVSEALKSSTSELDRSHDTHPTNKHSGDCTARSTPSSLLNDTHKFLCSRRTTSKNSYNYWNSKKKCNLNFLETNVAESGRNVELHGKPLFAVLVPSM